MPVVFLTATQFVCTKGYQMCCALHAKKVLVWLEHPEHISANARRGQGVFNHLASTNASAPLSPIEAFNK